MDWIVLYFFITGICVLLVAVYAVVYRLQKGTFKGWLEL